ncbi:hypothetical protein ABZ035_34990, partial [Streptomyces sp. NPDC006334]
FLAGVESARRYKMNTVTTAAVSLAIVGSGALSLTPYTTTPPEGSSRSPAVATPSGTPVVGTPLNDASPVVDHTDNDPSGTMSDERPLQTVEPTQTSRSEPADQPATPPARSSQQPSTAEPSTAEPSTAEPSTGEQSTEQPDQPPTRTPPGQAGKADRGHGKGNGGKNRGEDASGKMPGKSGDCHGNGKKAC